MIQTGEIEDCLQQKNQREKIKRDKKINCQVLSVLITSPNSRMTEAIQKFRNAMEACYIEIVSEDYIGMDDSCCRLIKVLSNDISDRTTIIGWSNKLFGSNWQKSFIYL